MLTDLYDVFEQRFSQEIAKLICNKVAEVEKYADKNIKTTTIL